MKYSLYIFALLILFGCQSRLSLVPLETKDEFYQRKSRVKNKAYSVTSYLLDCNQGKPKMVETVRYNSIGLKVETIDHLDDDKHTYIYDKGLLTTKKHYNKKGDLTGRNHIEYKSGRLVRDLFLNADSTTEMMFIYKNLDKTDADTIIWKKIIDQPGTTGTTSLQILEYDENGLLLTDEHEGLLRRYEYETNRKVRSFHYHVPVKGGSTNKELFEYRTYHYDVNGLLVKEKVYQKDKSTCKFILEYRYENG